MPHDDGCALRLRDLELLAPSGAPILQGIDWDLPASAVGCVVGASGSGKSRLLRALNRLDEPAGGDVELLGRPLAAWDVAELRRRVGWVPQRPALGRATARAAIEITRELGLVPHGGWDARADAALEVAGVPSAILGEPVSRLSGGERHRVALVRALTLEPELLLLDEPTSALDAARAAAVLSGVVAWARARGSAVVVVTHRAGDVRRLGGEMLALSRGRMLARGPAGEVLRDPRVRELLAGIEGGP